MTAQICVQISAVSGAVPPRVVLLMARMLNTLNIVRSANYKLSHDVRVLVTTSGWSSL